MGINPDMGAMCSKSSKKVHNAGSKENQNENESDYPAGGAKDLSLDAIVTLDQAKDEILRLRRVNRQQTQKNEVLEMRLSSSSSMPSDSTSFARYRARTSLLGSARSLALTHRLSFPPERRKKEARAAVLSRGSQDYEKQTVKKPDVVRDLIYHAIKRNMLFRSCSEEELSELVDVFAPSLFRAGSVVIKQGDDGDLFYIVEDGKLDVM